MTELLATMLASQQILSLLFVFLRISVVLFLLPIFGSVNLPRIWKASVALILTVCLGPMVIHRPIVAIHGGWQLAFMLGSEVLLGAILGLAVLLIFSSLEVAGEFMGFQMGFTIVNVIDPQNDTQTSVIGEFIYVLGLLIFFTINGHHYLLQAMIRSFELVPPGGFALHASAASKIVKLSGQMFVIGLKIAAPVIAALLLTTVALGIVSKTVPQINILIVGFPLNIGIGLLLFGFSIGTLIPYCARVFTEFLPLLDALMLGR